MLQKITARVSWLRSISLANNQSLANMILKDFISSVLHVPDTSFLIYTRCTALFRAIWGSLIPFGVSTRATYLPTHFT